ncbi:MFS transporter [Micromonospora sp. WMMD1082]|uniref:MFS transporter n=1 Tax=Micromonospora sp. WMMD1082 TaxID=3016104 RepID=UPI0024165EEC|nr:MFS transporter [Micromonospora sp. WMMD1082]MDG4795597.1 MFS transporter [Micromonospora sp. WMMD1082]
MSEHTGAGSVLLRGPLRPFRSGQYRLLAGAIVMALLAAGVWLIAVVWQVIEMGGGPGAVSLVATASAVGMLGSTLLGGVLADRMPQRRILLAVAGARAAAMAVVAALALLDRVDLWALAAGSLVFGVSNGFTYPAYSALLPSILPAKDLLAANGIEGTLRPTVMQAAGPAAASALIAAASPGLAIAAVAVLELAGMGLLLALRPVPLARDTTAGAAAHPIGGVLSDLRAGFVYVSRTPWLLATLLFASALILLMMGPIEVLMPFVIKDRANGGPGDHALVMAAFGIGGALGSMGMASLPRMPRRYLTVMNLLWGLSCAPLLLLGFARDVWVIAVAVFVTGILFSAPMVIWGTLLQRRVPSHLLGRVSSLDFFASLTFMPVSMALAAPVSAVVGLGASFVLVGLLPGVLAVLAVVLAKLPKDEIAHPLDGPGTEDPPGVGAAAPQVSPVVAANPPREMPADAEREASATPTVGP